MLVLCHARFHDLRHGSASMLLAAGVELKVASETMGHSTSAFTADVYVTVLEELSEAAAAAIAAFVPRRASNVPAEGRSDREQQDRHPARWAKCLVNCGGSGI